MLPCVAPAARQYCLHAVIGSPFLSVCLLSFHFGLSWCVGLGALLQFLFGFVRLEKL
jgi:hypothetical protein